MVVKVIDFGLVVLIWMTQLVVYPSFCYFQEKDLQTWHSKYTTAITIMVMPLMIGQVFFHIMGILQNPTWWRWLAAMLIVLVWVNTLFFAVPLHNRIAAGNEVLQTANRLVNINWYRTVLWTLVFLLGIMDLKLG